MVSVPYCALLLPVLSGRTSVHTFGHIVKLLLHVHVHVGLPSLLDADRLCPLGECIGY